MSNTELERWNERFREEGYHFGTRPNAPPRTGSKWTTGCATSTTGTGMRASSM
jgi:hypothetical protein